MLEKLLLAVDDSAQSRKAVPATAEPARDGGGTVNVLHVRELGASMIVVGSHGHSTLGGLLLGSVAHKLTQLSTCPVLVVRDEESLQERHHDVLRAQTRFQS
jgi:nucleotide-binding universal stress UspA family protein